jgi:hypothetical protein
MSERNCKFCGVDISHLSYKNNYCCEEHRKEAKKAWNRDYFKKKKIETNATLPEGTPVCPMCGLKSNALDTHLVRTHHMTVEEFTTKYPGLPVYSEEYATYKSERIKGDKNPAYQHGSELCPFSENFVGYQGKSQAEIDASMDAVKAKSSKSNRENGNNSTTLAYWLKSGMTEEEANAALSERQRTFTLEKCIEKLGEEEGTRRWKERQKKWLKSYKKNNFSKVSQELFWSVYNQVKDHFTSIRFATLDPTTKNPDATGVNHELLIDIGPFCVKPDFLVEDSKKIIEFNGDYWHSEKRPENLARDAVRHDELVNHGYTIFTVKECDYRQHPEEIINNCVSFLLN